MIQYGGGKFLGLLLHYRLPKYTIVHTQSKNGSLRTLLKQGSVHKILFELKTDDTGWSPQW